VGRFWHEWRSIPAILFLAGDPHRRCTR
jgi:hypothetical protein